VFPVAPGNSSMPKAAVSIPRASTTPSPAIPRSSKPPVFGVPGAGADEIWLALVPQEPIANEELRSFSKETLGARAPRHFLRLDRLPRNEAGKIVRNRLVILAQESRGRRLIFSQRAMASIAARPRPAAAQSRRR